MCIRDRCLPIAENHFDVGKILDKSDIVMLTQPKMLEQNIKKIFADRSLLFEMHTACKNLLDGYSTQRLAKELKQVLGQ